MAKVRCVIPISGKIVVTSSLKRYVFTRMKREYEIDEDEVEFFRAKVMRQPRASCNCSGDEKSSKESIKMFEVEE